VEEKVQSNKKFWWGRWEIWGVILWMLSALFLLFPESWVINKVGAGIGIILGGIKTIEGLVKGYRSDNLWKPIASSINYISNKK
jgi:hypothetical protein